jgi:hypothetical protein
MNQLRRQIFFIENLYFTISIIIFFVYLVYYLYIYSSVYINGNYGRVEKT